MIRRTRRYRHLVGAKKMDHKKARKRVLIEKNRGQ